MDHDWGGKDIDARNRNEAMRAIWSAAEIFAKTPTGNRVRHHVRHKTHRLTYRVVKGPVDMIIWPQIGAWDGA